MQYKYRIEPLAFQKIRSFYRNVFVNYSNTHAGNWYYAYSIDDDIITIHDACHAQNMHEWLRSSMHCILGYSNASWQPEDVYRQTIRKSLAVCELFFVVSSISAMAMGDDGEDDDEK